MCIIDCTGQQLPLIVVQYYFLGGEEVPVKRLPHGNAKRSNMPYMYVRTQKSTIDEMKNSLENLPPHEVANSTYKDAGGVMKIQSPSEVSRGRNQVYDLKKRNSSSTLSGNKDKDVVYDLIQQCHSSGLEEQGRFVRNVSFNKSVMSFVGLQYQFIDLERFCANGNPTDNSILGIDPTFNLGDFYVTITTYEHKMLVSKRTKKHPVFIGPCLIH